MHLWYVLMIFLILIFFLIGIVIGFLVTRYFISKQLEKNPIVDEDSVREMFNKMGRKPSEKQIQEVINASKQSAKKKYKRK